MPSQLARRRGITRAPVSVIACGKCQDFGFTGVESEAAKDVFENGIPCECSAGQQFAKQQIEWLKPIERRPKNVKR